MDSPLTLQLPYNFHPSLVQAPGAAGKGAAMLASSGARPPGAAAAAVAKLGSAAGDATGEARVSPEDEQFLLDAYDSEGAAGDGKRKPQGCAPIGYLVC